MLPLPSGRFIPPVFHVRPCVSQFHQWGGGAEASHYTPTGSPGGLGVPRQHQRGLTNQSRRVRPVPEGSPRWRSPEGSVGVILFYVGVYFSSVYS